MKDKEEVVVQTKKQLPVNLKCTAWKCANGSGRFGTQLYASMLTS